MKNFFKITSIILFIFPSLTWAKSNARLVEYFQNQIETLNHSVMASESPASAPDNTVPEIWYVNTFALRLRAPIGFEIGGFTTFQVIPETELVWQRSNPDGWINYSK
ncbi:MAG: hypothetical protein ACXVCY_13215 [Pseudobdellovibrionaceae bacterium]